MGDQVPWPPPPRDPGPWSGGPPVAPPGNTPLPPLPGSGGVVHGSSPTQNPWTNPNPIPQVNIPVPGGPAPTVPPDPGASRKADRAPAIVRVAALVIVIALIAGAAFVLLRGGRTYPKVWDPRAKDIAAWVEKERDLAFEHPVKVNFLTPEEYSKLATSGGDEDSEDQAQYYDDQVAFLRALGFVSGEVDLGEATDTLSDSGTLAYYDPEVEQVFVRGTELTPGIEVTLAHELTHVLQDQHFDLERLDQFEDGRGGVLRALAEGDATRIEDAYVEDQLTDDERKAYEEESAAGGDEAQEELDAKVPPILTTIFAAPYILGPELVDYLLAVDGDRAIDGALQDPPTEEVLFDPLQNGSDTAAPRTVTVTPPEGAEVLDQAEFGPTTLFLLLASRIDPKLALQATDGWGGDQYVTYRQNDQVCVAVALEGDSAEDTGEIGQALTSWSEGSPEGTATVETSSDQILFTACDPGKDAKGVSDEVTPDLLSLPVTRTILYVQALDGGRSDEQATCFATGIIDGFTSAQLSDPDGEYIQSDAGQAKIQKILAGCE